MVLPFVTDLHLRRTPPRLRTDPDYLGTQLGELAYVLAQSDCGHVLCGGDVFDSPQVSYVVVNRLIDLLREFEVHLVTTVGQHDVHGHNIKGYRENTPLGTLEAAGVCTVLISGQEMNVAGLTVFGFGYNEPETLDFMKGRLVPQVSKDIASVALVHASIANERFHDIEGIDEQNFKGVGHVLLGDIHAGVRLYKCPSETLAISPGAMARGSKTDLNRKVEYIRITLPEVNPTPSNTFFSLEEVPTLPGTEVFDMSVIEQKKAETSRDFRMAMERTRQQIGQDPEQLIEEVATILNASPESVKLVRDKIKVNTL